MKKIIFFMVVLSLFAFKAGGAELKIGYVDINRALNESDQGKEARKTLENMVKSTNVLIDEKAMEIRKLQEEVEKQASILMPESRKEKDEEIEKLVKNFQRMRKDADEELQKKNRELVQKTVLDLRKLIEKFGEEEGYTVIFEVAGGGILYIPEELDLTEEVIKRFNESIKTTENEEQKTKN